MRDKVVFLTGATSGVGRAAALAFARQGATLAVVGRSPGKLDKLVRDLRTTGNERVEGLLADLSLVSAVRRLATEFRARYDRLDVLVNNAGAIYTARELTAEGFERTWATNHLAYFVLTTALLDLLEASAPARVLCTASEAHRSASIRWDDVSLEGRYGKMGFDAYGQSKLANILFSRELARRLAGTGVTTCSFHPGFVASGFASNTGGLATAVMTLTRPFQVTPEKAAETVLWLAADPSLAGESGGYYARKKPKKPTAAALDDAAAARLWALTEAQVATVPA